MPYTPTDLDSPFHRLGGDAPVRAIAETFYDIMAREEPALARLHPMDAEGRIDRAVRERFGLFLVGWLGGPQDYTAQHGHPRLRMRHGHVPIDSAMRDAWLRCMRAAFDAHGVQGEVRAFLEARLGDVANFLRNRPG